jgi:hypothetical protein
MSLPSFERIQARFEHQRRSRNVVEINVNENTRKRFHRKAIMQSELDKNRRAGKRPLIDESTRDYLN